jgi:hypothetical protein
MKPRNFPARKLARKIAADIRSAEGVHESAQNIREIGGNDLDQARQIKSKKRRASNAKD